MARRRRESGLDVVASLPWPVGMAIGILAFLGIRYGIGFLLRKAGGPLVQGMGSQLGDSIAPLAWAVLAICWIAAGISFFRGRHRRQLLDVQSGLDSISAMSWRQFEMLVGEAFRRQGYSVQETGLGGADGGIDLILRKDERTELVQCKQWRARQVNVSVVREMWGLVAHHQAQGAKIVCIGSFTPEAAAFAAGKPIELITGQTLLSLVQSTQAVPTTAYSTPACAANAATPPCTRCGATMVLRTNKKTGEQFWGCSTYPRCRGTMQV